MSYALYTIYLPMYYVQFFLTYLPTQKSDILMAAVMSRIIRIFLIFLITSILKLIYLKKILPNSQTRLTENIQRYFHCNFRFYRILLT